jgi:hypothetical protein
MTSINWESPDYVRYAVDVTGDGRADLVAFGPDGIYVANGHGDGDFDSPVKVVNELGSNQGGAALRPSRSPNRLPPAAFP